MLLATVFFTPFAWSQTVLVPAWVRSEMAELAKEHPELSLKTYENARDAEEKIGDAEGFIGSPDEAIMKAGKNLRWVHIFSAGVENYVSLPGFQEGRVRMTCLKIHQGPEIADHAFALLLHLTRNMGVYQRAQDRGEWAGRSGLPLIELRGRTMLVVGYGGIGTQVAERAKAFGMTVHAIDPKDIPLTVTVERFGAPDELHEFLPLADVVVSCVPITPESDGMFGAKEFPLMKKGAYFINVSRGKVVDTAALAAALESGHLAGAGLDVTDPEPLPGDSPLWKMPNVILTPHIAGVSDKRNNRQRELVADNLKRFATGLPLKNLVDPAKGY